MKNNDQLKSCVKYLLGIFIVFFIISGIGLIVASCLVNENIEEFDQVIDENYNGPGIFLLALGSLILFISILGCCGCCTECYCLTMFFAACLGIIFVLEIAGGIAGFVLQDDIEDEVSMLLTKSMDKYNSTRAVREQWDKLQEDFACCGVDGSSDWDRKNISIPTSCCISNPTCDTTQPANLYFKGCTDALKDYLNEEVIIIGAVGVSLAFILVPGLLFACWLARYFHKDFHRL